MTGDTTFRDLLPEIRDIRERITSLLADLEAFDTRLREAAEMTHAATPGPDLPAEAEALTGAATNLADQLTFLNSRITRSERYTAIFAAILALIVLVGLYAGYLGYQVRQQSNQVATRAACQAKKNDAFQSAIQGRTDASKTERTAQRQLVAVLFNPDSTTAQIAKAKRDYQQGLDSADKQRADNPLPTGNCS